MMTVEIGSWKRKGTEGNQDAAMEWYNLVIWVSGSAENADADAGK